MTSQTDRRVALQIKQWLKGHAVHNATDDLCCPDFSCCHPKLAASVECKEAYLRAMEMEDDDTLNEIEMNFQAAYFISQGQQISFEEAPEDLNDYH